MSIGNSLSEIRDLCEQLLSIKTDWMSGENYVLEPNTTFRQEMLEELSLNESIVAELSELFSQCDGISLLDVHVGCFLHPSSKLRQGNYRCSAACESDGGAPIPVVILGSSGGGDVLALNTESGEVWLLPPGWIEDGTYFYSDNWAKVVAGSIAELLERIVEDMRAFIDSVEHTYVTSR